MPLLFHYHCPGFHYHLYQYCSRSKDLQGLENSKAWEGEKLKTDRLPSRPRPNSREPSCWYHFDSKKANHVRSLHGCGQPDFPRNETSRAVSSQTAYCFSTPVYWAVVQAYGSCSPHTRAEFFGGVGKMAQYHCLSSRYIHCSARSVSQLFEFSYAWILRSSCPFWLARSTE